MKKILFVIIFLNISFFIFSTNICFSDLKTGEYAYYLDLRGKPHYQGYIFIRDEKKVDSFFIRSLDLITSQEVRYYVEVKINGTKIEILKKDLLSGTETNESRQSIADLENHFSLYLKNHNKIDFDTEIDDFWKEFNYTLVYTYNQYLPLFKLNGIKMKGEEKQRYFIDRGGILSKNMKSFFEYKPLSNKEINTNQPSKNIVTNKSKQIKENDFSITLDNNWNKNNSLGFPAYWLNVVTERDAQIGVEKGNWNLFKSKGYNSLEDFIRYTLLFRTDYIKLNTIKLTKENERIKIRYILFDSNNVPNIVRGEYVIINDYLYIINFSAFENIYKDNLDYFTEIFDSITFVK